MQCQELLFNVFVMFVEALLRCFDFNPLRLANIEQLVIMFFDVVKGRPSP